MYNSMLAVAVKNNGKVVKEDKDNVYLPFDTEYSLYIKNLNTKKALVKISIDGIDVCEGGIVVPANEAVDIERFVKDNNDEGNRFKFIERSDHIEKHRGIGIEDGLIRVEFQFEKEINPILQWNPNKTYVNHNWKPIDTHFNNPTIITNTNVSAHNALRSTSVSVYNSSTSSDDTANTAEVNTSGITVPGSVSDQKFITVSSFPLELEKHVMVMKLLGFTDNKEPVKKVKLSRQKQKCVTCNHNNKANAKFCSQCGTSLIII